VGVVGGVELVESVPVYLDLAYVRRAIIESTAK